MSWIAPDVERSEHYPQRRNEPEQEMLRDWLDWHRATLLRKCAGLNASQLATRAVPPSNLSLLGLIRHMSDTERGWIRQAYRGEQVPDLYYRSDAPDADIEEADPAGAEQDFERYRAECAAVDAALERRQPRRYLHVRREDLSAALDLARTLVEGVLPATTATPTYSASP